MLPQRPHVRLGRRLGEALQVGERLVTRFLKFRFGRRGDEEPEVIGLAFERGLADEMLGVGGDIPDDGDGLVVDDRPPPKWHRAADNSPVKPPPQPSPGPINPAPDVPIPPTPIPSVPRPDVPAPAVLKDSIPGAAEQDEYVDKVKRLYEEEYA